MMKIEELLNRVTLGDVIDILPLIPDKSVHCVVTSPPYYAVRDYKIEPTAWPEVTFKISFGTIAFDITIPAMVCQLGHEPTPEAFVGHMVYIFRQVRRILRDDGTLWMNMGDCYNSKAGGYNSGYQGKHSYISEGTKGAIKKRNTNIGKLKQKDMVGVPWMLAFAMRSDGWYLRQEIIWHKRNPMPESTNDRCTKAHESVFLFSKKKRYFFDSYAISTEITDASIQRLKQNVDSQQGSLVAYGATRPDVKMKAGARERMLCSVRSSLR